MKAKLSSTKKLNETATWKVEPSVKIEYKSERHHEFSDPKTKPSVIVKLSGEHLAKERDKMRDKAVEKFEKIAKKRYGSIEGLFSAVCISTSFSIMYHLCASLRRTPNQASLWRSFLSILEREIWTFISLEMIRDYFLRK
jgi:hypothetical protein